VDETDVASNDGGLDVALEGEYSGGGLLRGWSRSLTTRHGRLPPRGRRADSN
jgi:hypothetical protein